MYVLVCGAPWGPERAPGFPEPELQMVPSCHMSAGNQTQMLLKNSKFSEPWSHLSNPSLRPLKNSLLFLASPPAPHASINSFLSSCMSRVWPYPFNPSLPSRGLLSGLIGSSSTSQLCITYNIIYIQTLKGRLYVWKRVWSLSDLAASLNIVCSSSPTFSENFIIAFFLIA